MTEKELRELGIVKKKGKNGTRFLYKSKDLCGDERYVTLRIRDNSKIKEILAEIEKARIKLKKRSGMEKIIKKYHAARQHRPETVRTSSYALHMLSLSPLDRRVCLDILTDTGTRESTRRLYLGKIHAFYAWCRAVGITDLPDPTADLRIRATPEPRKRIATDEEIARLVGMCEKDPDALMLVLLMLHTGCRISTAMAVRPGDWSRPYIRLKNVKAGRPYACPVEIADPTLADLLDTHTLQSPARAYYRIRRRMAAAFPPDATGERLTPHSLRHTWATRAIRAGVPLDVISRVLDHSSISVTLAVYARHSPEQIGDAVRAVDATMPKKG